MSIISQAIATAISSQLTQHLQVEKNAIEKEVSQLVYDTVMKTVPEDVLKCFKKHPRFFNEKKSVQLVGHGFNWKNADLIKALPLTTTLFTLTDVNEAKLIDSLMNKASAKHNEVRDLKQSIYNALIALRSYKSIEANFPEAAKYLPKKEGRMLPTVQLKEVREKLNSTQTK